MKKTLLFMLCFGCLLAGGMWAQQKAQIHIKKNVNGVESQETREIVIDENNSLEDVLRELNAQPELQEGLIDQQIEISILSEGDFNDMKQGRRSLNMPGMKGIAPMQRKPTLGVMLREANVQNSKNPDDYQVTITEVIANTPAAKAGLQSGDVILKINKQDISSSQQVIDQVQQSAKGGELNLVIERSGKRKKIKAVIEPTAQFESQTNQFNLLIGPDSITMFNITQGDSMKILQPFNLTGEGFMGGEAAFLGVTPSGKTTTSGVSIQVEENSPAESMGLLDEDVVLKFNDETIGDFSALAAAVRKCKPESPAELLILRDGKEKRITGILGKSKLSTSEDFQIFHDFKGMDDEGNYFYDFEFNMDAEDLQQQMEELFKNFSENPSIEGFKIPEGNQSNYLLRLEDASGESSTFLSLKGNTLVFDQLSLVPQVIMGSIEVQFTLTDTAPVLVQLKDKEGHTLLYEEKQLVNGNYQRTLELSAYPAGDYFIIIEQGSKQYAKKIVKYKS
jgi:C-terminal processing protease CtpA/Prc